MKNKKLKEILLHEEIQKLAKQMVKKQEQLRKICTHSKKITREDNREGGYDYLAQYHKITECPLCGKELDRQTTYGGYA
jgi:hypothetical protein